MQCDVCGLVHEDGQRCSSVATMPALDEMTEGQLAARMQSISEELDRLANRGDLDEADERRWAELNTEFEAADRQRRALKRVRELRRVRQALHSGVQLPGSETDDSQMGDDPFSEPQSTGRNGRNGRNRSLRDVFDLSNIRTFDLTPEQVGDQLRSRAKSAVEVMPGMTRSLREGATQLIERWDDKHGTIARHALIGGHPDYLAAFGKLARHGQNAVLTDRERHAVTRAMSLTDAEGGFLVPFQLDPTVIITSDGSVNQIRQIARQVVATGDVWHGVSAGATQWSWDPESTEVSDDTSTFVQPTVTVHKAQGFVPITVEALADAANVTEEVRRLMSEGKDDLESIAFATGSGTNEPFGIVTALAGTSSEIGQDGAVGEFSSVDVYGLLSALPAKHRARAAWLANYSIYTEIRQFATADGHDLWERIGADVPPLLVGKRTYEAEAMDGTISGGSADNLILAVGNFANYVIADRVGMTIELVPHLFGATNRFPTGERGWWAWYRTGADSVNDGAFRLLNVVGPV